MHGTVPLPFAAAVDSAAGLPGCVIVRLTHCASAGRHLATCSSDHSCKVWDLKSMALLTTLVGHQRWVWDCAFSADSSYLVTGTPAVAGCPPQCRA
jgi:WD40 repeat protein